MELDGNEKRIQALYCELSLENDSMAPQFERLWTEATLKKRAEVASFSTALVIAATVTAVACSIAVWSWYSLTASPPSSFVKQLPQQTIVDSPFKPNTLSLAPASPPVKAQPRRQKNTARRRDADRRTATEAAMLSNWQSPTTRFMESPTALMMNSLPQLNQSVRELESFLPRNNELMKESNR
jgi:hypothetical protein